jgi:hypothetical protein
VSVYFKVGSQYLLAETVTTTGVAIGASVALSLNQADSDQLLIAGAPVSGKVEIFSSTPLTSSPTAAPTLGTSVPTAAPTSGTSVPTAAPTSASPTAAPTSGTSVPTATPTNRPTASPTATVPFVVYNTISTINNGSTFGEATVISDAGLLIVGKPGSSKYHFCICCGNPPLTFVENRRSSHRVQYRQLRFYCNQHP